MPKPTLTCFGGVGTVTGANFLLETYREGGEVGKRVLIDCGLFQGFVEAEKNNKSQFEYDPTKIDYLFITHSHIDHIGRIPDIVSAGFSGIIYSTEETREIAEWMLRDLIRIAKGDVEAIHKIMSLWKTLPYRSPKDFEDFTIELLDAGHILGSSMYFLTFPSGRKLLFTGDLGHYPSPIEKKAEVVSDASYILMDSVYGDRNHQESVARDEQFKKIIEDVIERKSTLLIPVFSLERTQVMLFELDKLFETKGLKKIPVFLDSPLAINITDIYRRVLGKGREDFDFDRLKETAQVRDSVEIASVNGPKIILAGSGMSTAGRIVHHEERYLPDPNATLLFVGYQAVGTLGRLIQDGIKEVLINDKNIKIKAKVLTISGFSAHAGSDELVEFVSHSAKILKKVFITMGEIKSSIFLAQRLKDELGVSSVIPERGKKYELDL